MSVFSEDGIAVMTQNTGGVEDFTTTFFAIDTSGKVLFSFSSKEYIQCSQFINGYLAVQNSDREVFLLDKQGKRVLSIGKWDDDGMFSILGVYDNMVAFEQGRSYGLKHLNGETAIRAKYDRLLPYNCLFVKKGEYQDLYLAEKNDSWGLINNKDEVKIPFSYAELYPWNNNLLLAGNGMSFNLIDLNDKVVCRENIIDITMISIIQTTFVVSDASGEESRKIEKANNLEFDTLAVDSDAPFASDTESITTDSNYSGY